MVKTSWTVRTESNVDFVADAVLSDPSETNTITRGDTATYVLSNTQTMLTVPEAETYTIPSGETERYVTVVVNGTLEINGTLEVEEIDVNGNVTGSGTLVTGSESAFDFDDLEPYATYAGKYSLTETLASQQSYNELIPPSIDINTLLVAVIPNNDLQNKNVNGYWGLIDNITDNRNRALSNTRVELEITVLAPFDEYADHAAVQTDLEVPL